jgi:hypothetical protein
MRSFQVCEFGHNEIELSAIRENRSNPHRLSNSQNLGKERRLMTGLGAKPENKVLAQPSWPDEVYRVLKQAGVRQVGMVPDAGHSRLIRAFEADPETRLVTLTTEEEGVAMLAGAWLGGQRGVLLLQSSGVGNCINMLSLPTICHMPLLMLVTMRGDWGSAILPIKATGRCSR